MREGESAPQDVPARSRSSAGGGSYFINYCFGAQVAGGGAGVSETIVGGSALDRREVCGCFRPSAIAKLFFFICAAFICDDPIMRKAASKKRANNSAVEDPVRKVQTLFCQFVAELLKPV
jgi:hypothetical protein